MLSKFSPLLLTGVLFTLPMTPYASENSTIRYVSELGVDSGVCSTAAKPCRHIGYAANQSYKGDSIYVASGDYHLNDINLSYLSNSSIDLKGGYSANFKTHDSNKFLSTIVGVPINSQKALSKDGFNTIRDIKSFAIAKSVESRHLTKSQNKGEGASACDNGLAATYECHNIDMQSHIPLNEFSSSPSNANDVWGFIDLNNQREYAIIGSNNSTIVMDITDPTLPVEIGSISGINSTWRDVKVYQYFDNTDLEYKAYAYVTTEARSQGMQILDLTDLPNQVTLAATISEFSTAHNVYISNINYADGTALAGLTPYIYIIGSNKDGGAFRVFDLDDPTNPTLVATESNSSFAGHDSTSLTITDSRTSQCVSGNNPCEIFVNFNGGRVDIWDMSDKNTPTRLSSIGFAGSGYIHSGWPSSDKMTIFVQDELDERNTGANTTLRSLDISDLTSPQFVGTYTGQTAAIDHNGFAIGNYYYMSNYRRGLSVIDVTDPTDMKDLALFDTFSTPAENTAEFNGAWGVFPFLPSGNILISDIENGLFVLKLNENDGAFPTAPPSGGNTGGGSNGVGNTSGGGGGSFNLYLIALFLIVKRKTTKNL